MPLPLRVLLLLIHLLFPLQLLLLFLSLAIAIDLSLALALAPVVSVVNDLVIAPYMGLLSVFALANNNAQTHSHGHSHIHALVFALTCPCSRFAPICVLVPVLVRSSDPLLSPLAPAPCPRPRSCLRRFPCVYSRFCSLSIHLCSRPCHVAAPASTSTPALDLFTFDPVLAPVACLTLTFLYAVAPAPAPAPALTLTYTHASNHAPAFYAASAISLALIRVFFSVVNPPCTCYLTSSSASLHAFVSTPAPVFLQSRS